MSDKIKLSHKKFYNKWLYKVSIRVPGISIIRSMGITAATNFCSGPNPNKKQYAVYQKAWENRQQLLSVITFLESSDQNIFFKRLETHTIDIYTNDKNFYNDVFHNFSQHVLYRAEPKTLDINLLNQANSIVVTKYPHDRYKHKVFLLPHKLKHDKISKSKFIDWVENQRPRVTCTAALKEWFIKTEWNWDPRYILVEDDKTLMLLKLRNSDVIGRVYNYVLCDK